MDSENIFQVTLNINELIKLDGNCNKDAQTVISRAKKVQLIIQEYNISINRAVMVVSIIDEALRSGKLDYKHKSISRCKCCGRYDGHYDVKRSTKYKKKGTVDWDNPKLFNGFDLSSDFVSMKNSISIGYCVSCQDEIKPILTEELKSLECELPSALSQGLVKYTKYKNKECTECGWLGHEGDMLDCQSMTGGKYKGGCPSCDAENLLFTTPIKTIDGFVIVGNKDA